MISPVLVSAIVAGSLLTLLSMGFTLQYITLRVPNLAHGSIALFSGYMTLAFYFFGLNPYVALPFSFLACGLITLALFRFLSILESRGIDRVGLMISTLGFDLIIYAFTNIFSDYVSYTLKIYTRSFVLTNADFTLAGLPGIFFASLILCVGLTIGFHFLLTRTKLGVAMRAIVESHSLAKSQGINTDFVLGISWFLVGGIAGIAGGLYPMWFYIDPWTAATILTRILAACVVGGLYSIYGSMTGGFIVGGLEGPLILLLIIFVGSWVSPYELMIPLVITAIALLIAPKGLAGTMQQFMERRVKA